MPIEAGVLCSLRIPTLTPRAATVDQGTGRNGARQMVTLNPAQMVASLSSAGMPTEPEDMFGTRLIGPRVPQHLGSKCWWSRS
jgi:hypothetical protein